jgi:hypothetical protein
MSAMTAATEEVKKAGHAIITITGCVQQPNALCKFIDADGTRQSVAVKSEVAWLFWLKVPSAAPVPPDTHVVAKAVTVGAFSLKCGAGTEGNIVFYWQKTGKACPKP